MTYLDDGCEPSLDIAYLRIALKREKNVLKN